MMGRLIAIMLLLAQVLVGSVRGQVICIPLGPCEEHAPHEPSPACTHSGCDHHHSHGEDAGDGRHHHHHGPFDTTGSDPSHLASHCDCHLHVALPHGQPLPAAPDRSDDSRGLQSGLQIAVPVAIVAASEAPSALRRPPIATSFASGAQALSLKSTRLRL